MKSYKRLSAMGNFLKFSANPIRHRRNVWPWFVGASVLLGVVYAIVPASYRSGSVLLTAVGSLWALAFYLHGRHAEDAKFVKELLTDFNQRYDDLGTDLQRAIQIDEAFDVDTQLRFVKYFNLCAEEWLFWRAGYIYDPVWRAWENGMKQYAPDPRIIDLWKKESATDSYYGFEFPLATIEGTSPTKS